MQLAPDDPWAGYARTVVEIRRPREEDLVVRAAPFSESDAWPWESLEAVHLLTAWDPGSERPGDVVNRARQVALEVELRAFGCPMWASIGIDPVTGRREEGVAIHGLDEAEVLGLAARYHQEAIFAWTPGEWAIVACTGGRRAASGWSLAPRRTAQ